MAKNDLARLQVILEAESSRLTKGLDKVDNRMKKWERKTSRSVNSVKAAFAGVISVAAVATIANRIKETAAAFEVMEAQLKTVTGSAQNAQAAIKTIEDTTKVVPATLEEMTKGFVKLKALGLDPSKAALISYSNTALAMGKSLEQMIEAVADATTGEFERLKEFGIKAKSEGENVSFIFQGVTTTIGKNAEEIEGYLRGIGDVQFAGAAAAQMDTIQGKTITFNNSVDRLFKSLGDAGLTKVFKDSLDSMINWTNKIGESKEVIQGVVDVVKFLINVISSAVLAIKDMGQAIGALAARTQALFELDFTMLKSINEQRDKERAANEAALSAIWKKTEAQEEYNEKVTEGAAISAGGQATGEGGQGHETDAELQKFRGQLIGNLESLEEYLMTKEEREQEAFHRRQEMLEESLEAGIISEDRFRFLSESLEEKHLKRMQKLNEKHMSKQHKLWQQSWKGKLQVASGVLGMLSNLMQSENKKQFEIGKQAAIAQTVINTYQMAVSSYNALASIPYVGPFLGAAAAAAAIAYGVTQVNSIKSQQFQGGGGVSAATPTFSANPNTGAPTQAPGFDELQERGEPERTIDITINGNPSKDQVRELIDQINEEIGDGVELRTA